MKFIIKYDEKNISWSSIEAAFMQSKTFFFSFLNQGRFMVELFHHENEDGVWSFEEYINEFTKII